MALTLLIGLGQSAVQAEPTPGQIQLSDDVFVRPLTNGVWLRTAYLRLPEFGGVPANGLIVVDGTEAALVDLPWTDVKTADATGLGNTKESGLASYPKSLELLKRLAGHAAIVVPGHGQPGGPDLIDHTLALCAEGRHRSYSAPAPNPAPTDRRALPGYELGFSCGNPTSGLPLRCPHRRNETQFADWVSTSWAGRCRSAYRSIGGWSRAPSPRRIWNGTLRMIASTRAENL
jgi:hypothetical protein